MQILIRDIGTSKGIIIPASLLREYNMSGAVEVEASQSGILLKPIRKTVRSGWDEDAKSIAAASEECALIPDVFIDEDLSWWEWEEND